jgi:DNA-binding response OmpR family regulator
MTPAIKYKIAIVEDDQPIRLMYEMRLKKAGFVVKTAADGEQGYELVKNFLPDLILLDIRMPGMNGDELLEKVRRTEWGAGMRVIVLTNTSKAEAPMGLRMLRVDRYVVKAHHTPSQITEIIQEVLHTQ